MSYQTQGKKINAILLEATKDMDERSRNQLVNGILWFGQVTKYRCRSNATYDIFARIAFKEMAKIRRFDSGLGFATLQVDVGLDDEVAGAVALFKDDD